MFKDELRDSAWTRLRQRGLRPFAGMLTPQAMQTAAAQAGIAVSQSALNVCTLTWLGLVGALHTAKSFADVLTLTWKLLEDAQCPLPPPRPSRRPKLGKGRRRSKHDPRGTSLQVTEEAFALARPKLPLKFWLGLLMILGEEFQRRHPEHVRWKRFRLLMLDGTDIALPRYKALLNHYGAAGSGQARTPQARMLMLALTQSRLPWRYTVVPQSCHEQTAAKELLADLRADDLVLMDRGFWSYGLFWQIQQQQAWFAIRLRRGIEFRRRERLGPSDELVEWTPSRRSRKRCSWAGQGLPPSIRLRVIHYRVPGFRPSAVVTNLLSPGDVSCAEWVRLAALDERGQVLDAGLYHRRWDIETLFYELKVFQGLEGSLRSRTPESIEFEIAGHVLLYTLIRWLMVEAATAHGVDPLQLSFKHALQEFEDLRPWLVTSPPRTVATILLPRLLARIAAHRIDVRPGRHFSRLGDRYKLGKYRKRSKTNTKQT
jgi:hypothetical protein